MKNVSTEFSNSKIVKTAKNNPLPFVLIGVGAELLAYKGYAGTLNPRHAAPRIHRASRRSLAPRSSIDDTAPGTFDNVTSKVTDAAGTAIDKVSGALDTARVGAML